MNGMERFDCPEPFCIQAFRPQEMVAHLKWDHGYSAYRAEQRVENKFGESPTEKTEGSDR